MNKLIIFDLDGVLVDSRNYHYESLNKALEKINKDFVITKDEHLSMYDGLSTTVKLNLLSTYKGLDSKYFDQIWKDKQSETFKILSTLTPDFELIDFFKSITSNNIKVAVASNSIRKTLQLVLLKLGILEYIDYFVSAEEVKLAKPYPEMYWKCMTFCNAIPNNTVIFEDSHIGRKAALDSGAKLITVLNRTDLTKEKINQAIEFLSVDRSTVIPWIDKKMNILIPMAGAGSRFSQAGYTFPKPLIDVNGKPMIQLVVESLNIDANYIFIVKKDHREQYNLREFLNLIVPGCQIVEIDELTEGAACTTLMAKELIDNDMPLLISNSDQFIEWNSNECLYAFSADEIDGGILTFKATHPKWSYAKLGDNGFVEQVAEKNPISDNATVGVYYWKHGSDFVKYAQQMIEKNIRVNNEFYVCPVYNEAIQDGKKIKIKQIDKMWGLGTPEDLDYFLKKYN